MPGLSKGSNRPSAGARATLAQGTAAAFVLSTAGVVIGDLLQIVLPRWMGGAEGYGKFALGISWARILAFVAGLGFPMAALCFMAQYLEHQDTARLTGFICGGRLLSLSVAALMAVVGTVLTFTLVLLALREVVLTGLWLSPLLALVNLHNQVVRGARRIVLSLAAAQVLYPLLVIAAAFVLFWSQGGLSGSHALWLVGAAAVANVVLNAVLIPVMGIEDAAVATSASIVLRNLWASVLVRRHLGIHCFTFFTPKPPTK